MNLILHHIGIACENIDEQIAYMKTTFGELRVGERTFDELQDAELCMLYLADGSRVELIAGKQVERLVKKRQFLYHTCYLTDNLSDKMKLFVEQGAMVVSEPKPARLFDGARVAFLMTELGLIELLEKKE